jgi:hypothetical protein
LYLTQVLPEKFIFYDRGLKLIARVALVFYLKQRTRQESRFFKSFGIKKLNELLVTGEAAVALAM